MDNTEQVSAENAIKEKVYYKTADGRTCLDFGFQRGNKLGRGRPKKSKNQIENIRRRILMVVERRIFREKDLETVSTPELLKFLASIMPKEGQVIAPQVTYISSIPRETIEVKQDELPAPAAATEDQPGTAIAPEQPTENPSL